MPTVEAEIPAVFAEVVELLSAHPGRNLRFSMGNNGAARGLRIAHPRHDGHVFIYPPQDKWGSSMLELVAGRTDLVTCVSAADMYKRIVRWADPRPWTAPAPLDVVAERSRLQRIHEGLTAREQAIAISESAREAASSDLASLEPIRLLQHFPADDRGRLAARTEVVLSWLGPAPTKKTQRALVARSPKGTAPAPIAIDVAEVRANAEHVWHDLRWRWILEPEPARDPRVAQCLELFARGELVEALSLFAIRVGEDVRRIIGGHRISAPGYEVECDHAWTETVIATIRGCAPWAITELAPKLRNKKKLAFVLTRLAKESQSQGEPKAALILHLWDPDDDPALTIENADHGTHHLPRSVWQRSIWVDLQHSGLA